MRELVALATAVLLVLARAAVALADEVATPSGQIRNLGASESDKPDEPTIVHCYENGEKASPSDTRAG